MSEPQDVILVTVDSIRADHCGYAGYEKETTPTLDRMARDGLTFENAIATASATHGSTTTFLTGADPVERPGLAGLERAEMKEHIRRHVSARQTLPERFSEMGYETAAFTTNPWTSRYFGFDSGFDHFEDFMDADASEELIKDGRQDGPFTSLLVMGLNWWQGQDMFMSWEAFYDDLQTWIDDAESPYFLWVFLVDAHLPYLPGEGFRSQSRLLTYPANLWLFAGDQTRFEPQFRNVLLEAYDDSLRYTDEFLRRLTDHVGDDPLVAVHGDHGEEFGEHGMYGHGSHLYEEMINVPLVVTNGPTGTVERPFSLRNLPSLLTSLAIGEDLDLDEVGEPYVISRNRDPRVAVRGDFWKYIWSPRTEELYALDDEETPLDSEVLLDASRELVEAWRESQAEQTRIVKGVEEVAASGRL